MKLLFDQNLSDRLVAALDASYPGSQHVRVAGLSSADDAEVWQYARLNDLVLVSKDSDFCHRSMLLGHPPKVVWIRLGNCTTEQIRELLEARRADVATFGQDPIASLLALA